MTLNVNACMVYINKAGADCLEILTRSVKRNNARFGIRALGIVTMSGGSLGPGRLLYSHQGIRLPLKSSGQVEIISLPKAASE